MNDELADLESEIGRQYELIELVGGIPYQVNLGLRQYRLLIARGAGVPSEHGLKDYQSMYQNIPVHFTDAYDQIEVKGRKK